MHKLAETPDNNRTPRRHAALARAVHIAHMKALRIRRKSPPGLRSGVKATKALAKGCSKPSKFRAQVFYDGILKSWIGKPETIHLDGKWGYRRLIPPRATGIVHFPVSAFRNRYRGLRNFHVPYGPLGAPRKMLRETEQDSCHGQS
jgi:hypothetical protein